MRSRIFGVSVLITFFLLVPLARSAVNGNGGWTVIGWNNLGMHCMDRDFSVFAILPPYNSIYAQVMDANGLLIRNATGITVTYQAVADPTGSINTTSIGKTNFWQFVQPLFGASPAPDVGLTGLRMPGSGNTPQPMGFDSVATWFGAEGVPITPTDDAGRRNSYPMMHIVLKDSSGHVLTSSDIVLPISDEMDCTACHASGSDPAAMPAAGWVWDCSRDRDYRLNILRLHDDRWLGNTAYQAALAQAGYNAGGLFPTVVTAGSPILCARCHASNALPGTGYAGIPPLTESEHGGHAAVIDPVTGLTLDASTNRSACYRCHPGSTTKCLRGAMGASVAADGTMAIQCQSCHGSMSRVGAAGRVGWLDEPTCQNCHTGTATHNNGQIRYTSAFDTNGQPRVAVDQTFATTPNVPATGFSLYRFSTGHGGLACEACHNSTHAEYPSTHPNDNIQATELQGHLGMLVECNACHPSQPTTVTGGPHGMHPVGQQWVNDHADAVEQQGGPAPCQACHGTDYSGTVLSRAQATRTLSTSFGTKSVWRGFRVGCYTCHLGPANANGNPNQAPVAANATLTLQAGTPTGLGLVASDPNGDALALRIVTQPQHGTVALVSSQATYYPSETYVGTDSFTFAAWDGQTDSNLGTVTVQAHGSFADVPIGYWAGNWIERLYHSGVTAGCGTNPLVYCPEQVVTRAEMAVLIEAAKRGTGFVPPRAAGIFGDVPSNYWAADWIEQLFNDHITAGCSVTPLLYCPESPVTRAEMAVFLMVAEHGASCPPPAATGTVFTDVPASYWAAPWIEQLDVEGITAGCGNGMFCPEAPVTRAQMAVFLTTMFKLQ